ncbi:OX-2 membrane glycoprotein-like isoform X2 [Macrotis lagotis]|uniref:OX-2 membrane glycoprotein-like isoform X2 n=1 Tax=Macrotis lagotis TaxID=92651 RepID=UPI003D6992BC
MLLLIVCVVLSLSGSMVAGMGKVIHKTKVTSTVGENVTLSCQLSAKNDVLQVTWQKEGQTIDNIATYSPNHGPRLLGSYHNHVHVTQRDLKSSAITFKSVSLEDEGCYRCIFSVFPIGPVQGRMCLNVFAISKPKVDAQLLTREEGDVVAVSCQATGKPAPRISWDQSDDLVMIPHLSYVWHPNKTVTVISNFTYNPVQLLKDWSPFCTIHHPVLNTTIALNYPIHKPSVGESKLPLIICLSVVTIVPLLVLYIWKQSKGTCPDCEALLLGISWLTPKTCCGKFWSTASPNIPKQERTADV